MPGRYLLDGYNFLFRLLPDTGSLRTMREALLSDLGEKAHSLNLKLSVVFDAGAQKQEEGKHYSYHTLDVLFTPYGITADEWIIREVQQAQKPQNITVVTSDKALQRQVCAYGGYTQPVEDFLGWLQQKCERKKRKKIAHPPPLILAPPKPKTLPNAESNYLEIFEKRFEELMAKQPRRKTTEKAWESEYRRWLRLFEDKLSQELF